MSPKEIGHDSMMKAIAGGVMEKFYGDPPTYSEQILIIA
jgi:hypothetical protein